MMIRLASQNCQEMGALRPFRACPDRAATRANLAILALESDAPSPDRPPGISVASEDVSHGQTVEEKPAGGAQPGAQVRELDRGAAALRPRLRGVRQARGEGPPAAPRRAPVPERGQPDFAPSIPGLTPPGERC